MSDIEDDDRAAHGAPASDEDSAGGRRAPFPEVPKAVRLLGPAPQLVWVHVMGVPDGLTAEELADRTDWSARHVREAANDLARQGFIERRPDLDHPTRYKFLPPSDSGRRRVE